MKPLFAIFFFITHTLSPGFAQPLAPLCPLESKISQQQLHQIGEVVYKNETNKKKELLTHWNSDEEFASMGIGHFIWFPHNWTARFKEVFPEVLQYIRQHLKPQDNIKVPAWLDVDHYVPLPWNTHAEFEQNKSSKKMTELNSFLAHPKIIELQAAYMVERANETLARVLESIRATHPKKYTHASEQLYWLTQSALGIQSPVDYVNFKGDGTDIKDSLPCGLQWGLKQVLLTMPASNSVNSAGHNFANAVIKTLSCRAHNELSHRKKDFIEKWLPVWIRRANNTYRPKKN